MYISLYCLLYVYVQAGIVFGYYIALSNDRPAPTAGYKAEG
jgi:hypothetical protein